MEPKKILFISQEITPYLPENEMSIIGRQLPQGILEKGKEIRTFMPKFGGINERRNQLHEVIRLSGINIVIDGIDHPLIIKVASIQAARMQVYFLDNEDFFARKGIFKDENNQVFDDNDERLIFFSRGIFETVKKLRWNPDIIYCQGWFTGLIPVYLKKLYSKDPTFAKTKIIYSCFGDQFEGSLGSDFINKAVIEDVSQEDLKQVDNPTFININKLAIDYSDGIIIHSQDVLDEIKDYAANSKKPSITIEGDNYVDQYNDFFDRMAAD